MTETVEQAARRAALDDSRGGGKVCPPTVKKLLHRDQEGAWWLPTDFRRDGVPLEEAAETAEMWGATFEGILDEAPTAERVALKPNPAMTRRFMSFAMSAIDERKDATKDGVPSVGAKGRGSRLAAWPSDICKDGGKRTTARG
jgi:hypothetical protein